MTAQMSAAFSRLSGMIQLYSEIAITSRTSILRNGAAGMQISTFRIGDKAGNAMAVPAASEG